MPQFTFTFGSGHAVAPDRYVIVDGTDDVDARLTMFGRYGSRWAFQYGSPEEAGAAKYGLRRACFFGDATCPCQDGDLCHYVDGPDGTKAATPPPSGLEVAEAIWARDRALGTVYAHPMPERLAPPAPDDGPALIEYLNRRERG